MLNKCESDLWKKGQEKSPKSKPGVFKCILGVDLARSITVCSPQVPYVFRQRIMEQQKCSRAAWSRWDLLGNFFPVSRLGSSTDLVMSPAVLHCPAPRTTLSTRH